MLANFYHNPKKKKPSDRVQINMDRSHPSERESRGSRILHIFNLFRSFQFGPAGSLKLCRPLDKSQCIDSLEVPCGRNCNRNRWEMRGRRNFESCRMAGGGPRNGLYGAYDAFDGAGTPRCPLPPRRGKPGSRSTCFRPPSCSWDRNQRVS